jgi:hypothetical protein
MQSTEKSTILLASTEDSGYVVNIWYTCFRMPDLKLVDHLRADGLHPVLDMDLSQFFHQDRLGRTSPAGREGRSEESPDDNADLRVSHVLQAMMRSMIAGLLQSQWYGHNTS